MNREEIKKIGLEAGISEFAFGLASEEAWQQVERFAALVAAAEREACAKLAETPMYRHEIAEKIRARGEK